MGQLPIFQSISELCATLGSHSKVVLTAPPGSGKTTIVPLELIKQPWLTGKKIVMLEPRRLAARASAARMADLLGEQVGETVGYRIRLESKVSEKTRIEVVTEGILTRLIQQDPTLEQIGLVIFDEFHERNLQGDLALALTLDLMEGFREDLRLLVMSATLDSAALSGLLDEAPVVVGEGQSHPVEIHYLEREPTSSPSQVAFTGVLRALNHGAGDVLVFLPGVAEIKAVKRALLERSIDGLVVCPLYGNLTKQQQDQAIMPDRQGRRRVILSTSIAETSLTIEGITMVVDSGLSRYPTFNPNSGLSRLHTGRVSRASADQRAGRAGRLGPGACYRLWTKGTHSQLAPNSIPEILEADLTQLVLELVQWGVVDPSQLSWIDPPPSGAYSQSRELLHSLGAIDAQQRLTSQGEKMALLGVQPRLAKMLLEGGRRGQLDLASDIAALVSERDLMVRGRGAISIDIEERLHQLQLWREQGKRGVDLGRVDISACRLVDQSSRQMRQRAGRSVIRDSSEDPLSVGGLLALAFPDRIALCKSREKGSYQMVLGRRALVPQGDLLAGRDSLVIADMDAGKGEGRIFLAAEISFDEIRMLEAQNIEVTRRVEWSSQSRSVMALCEERLGSLVLSEKTVKDIDPSEVSQAMVSGIEQMGLQALPWSSEVTQLKQRIAFLRHHQPDGGWPDLSDARLLETLEEWIAPWLAGISRSDHLRRLDLKQIILSKLSWEQQQLLDRLAPIHYTVPSGSRKRIDYSDTQAPVLAVRIQEVFGCHESPEICHGQVPLVMHLLSPAQRPIQVTQDLAGFWQRTYQSVKKELKGRYPKHYWPEDPLVAEPTSRAKPRKK